MALAPWMVAGSSSQTWKYRLVPGGKDGQGTGTAKLPPGDVTPTRSNWGAGTSVPPSKGTLTGRKPSARAAGSDGATWLAVNTTLPPTVVFPMTRNRGKPSAPARESGRQQVPVLDIQPDAVVVEVIVGAESDAEVQGTAGGQRQVCQVCRRRVHLARQRGEALDPVHEHVDIRADVLEINRSER